MAKTSKKRHNEILQNLFKILIANPNGIRAKEAVQKLSSEMSLTEYELGSYTDGVFRFDKIVRFATISSVKAGWIIKDSGIWSITDEGENAYNKFKNSDTLFAESENIYKKWYKEKVQDSTEMLEEDNVDENNTSITLEKAEEQAFADIETYLESMPPYEFQNLVGDLLTAMGYFVEWIASKGKDGGVDIIAYTDPLGTQGPRIKVQVKRQKTSVSLPDLKSFIANVDGHDSGIFVCTGGFTSEALNYTRSVNKRLMLIDMKKLLELWIEYMPKLEYKAWQRLPLKAVYFIDPQ